MREFYVTFGCQYSREPHPRFVGAHPDGWFTIEAENEMHARQIAVTWLGTAWAFIYDEPLDLPMFPRGELHRVSAMEQLQQQGDED